MYKKYYCEGCPDKEEGCQVGCYSYDLVPENRKDRLDLSIHSFEKETGTKLLPYQKELLNKIFEKDIEEIKVVPVRQSGRSFHLLLMSIAHSILFHDNQR